jgi:hypothetical protein
MPLPAITTIGPCRAGQIRAVQMNVRALVGAS